MKIKLWSIIAMLFFTVQGMGQSLNKVLEEGDKAYESRDYYTAYRCYEKVLEYEDKHYGRPARRVRYQQGLAAQRFNYFSMADTIFRGLIREDAPKDSIYALSTYYLGQSVLVQARTPEDYQKAKGLFERVQNELLPLISEQESIRNTYRRQAEAGIRDANFGESRGSWVPQDTLTRLADPHLNSRFSDYAPKLYGDTLYFSSLRFAQSVRRQSTTYSRNLFAVLSGEDSLYVDTVQIIPQKGIFNEEDRYTNHRALSADGSYVVFTSCEQQRTEINCKLYRRQLLSDGSWSEPQLLNVNDETAAYTTKQPAFFRDCSGQEYLVFASDRPGGEGGLDLWQATFNAQSGRVGAPVNLGDTINTIFDEESPYFWALNSKLYFSSNRPGGYGQHDLFVSRYDNGIWSEPENLGAPYNSGYNDMYYFSTPDGSRAFLSSDRPRSMRFIDTLDACCQDIYTRQLDLKRSIELQLAQCEEKPTGVGGTQLTVEDITICGQESIVFDTTVSDPYFRMELPARRFRKYRISASTSGLSQDSSLVIDFARPEFERDSTPLVDFSQYPDFLELEIQPDIANAPDREAVEFALTGTVTPKVTNSLNGENLGAIAGDNTFRLAFNEPYDIGMNINTPNNQDTITGIFGEQRLIIKATRVDGVVFPEQSCQPVCREKVFMPLTAEVIFDPSLFFDNDRPLRTPPPPRQLISVTQEQLGEITSEYEGLLEDYQENNDQTDDAVQGRIGDFFDDELKGGIQELQSLPQRLYEALEQVDSDQRIVVEIKGYCSTRGGSIYNDSLAIRRIQCITDFLEEQRIDTNGDGNLDSSFSIYMETWQVDSLQKRSYVKGDRPIIIVPKPLGESTAGATYPETGTASKYSIGAALDRRVELTAIARQDPPTCEIFKIREGCADCVQIDESISKNPER